MVRIRARLFVSGLMLLAIPVLAALGVSKLDDSAHDRQLAANHLVALSSDVHLASEDFGWAVATQEPPSVAEPHLNADLDKISADLTKIEADGTATQTSQVIASTQGYSATLRGSLRLLSGGNGGVFLSNGDTVSQQRDAVIGFIDRTAETTAADAATTQTYVKLGIWIVVLMSSMLLIAVLWRMAVRQRRLAVAQAQRSALEESERSFRLLFERNPMPMWIYDAADLCFLSANSAAIERYGYSREEFLELSVLDIRPPEDREAFIRERRIVPGGSEQSAKAEVRHMLRDGEIIDVEVAAERLDFVGREAVLVLAKDVTDQRRLERELRDRAFRDSLTNLPNRALFADRFEQAQLARSRDDRGLGVITIDLDGFKTINDHFGHQVGDSMLLMVSTRLTEAIRAADTAARLGGDEFAILAESGDEESFTALAERVLAHLSTPYVLDGAIIELSASLGLVCVASSDASWERALQDADIAMYAAKSSGKACVRVFRDGMQSTMLSRMQTATELRGALSRGELLLYYQPIVSTSGERVLAKVEALVRWRHPERGLIGPAEFIPIAEETGAIIALGEWVLQTACTQVAAWRDEGRNMAVAVNVSGRQLRERDFTEMVKRIVRETGIDPKALVLEVTETAMLDDLDAAQEKLTALRADGIGVALDDFGAGFSSLAYLSELPVDIVKIDRSFIATLGQPERLAMMLTIIRLLDTLAVSTVAEGVETAQEFAYVSSLGVDACQGYFFGRPVPASELFATNLESEAPKQTAA